MSRAAIVANSLRALYGRSMDERIEELVAAADALSATIPEADDERLADRLEAVARQADAVAAAARRAAQGARAS